MRPRVLALFFTRGVSLRDWVERGMFGREKRLYEELLSRGHADQILWLTYGANDRDLADDLIREGALHPGIRVLPMPSCLASKWASKRASKRASKWASKWGMLLYSLVAPLVYRRELRAAFVFKTNQMDGAWTAWIAALLLHRPLYLRTGFTLSLFEARRSSGKTLRARLFAAIETMLYRRADVAAVSSSLDRAYVTERCGAKNAHIVRNYVDTARFNPTNRQPMSGRMVFVGRLSAQKNLGVFVKSLAGSGWSLHLYGEGPERAELERLAGERGVEAVFHGTVPNSELPAILSRAGVFVLPSLYEGMPKALLEAMACGCLCLGADVPGVREVITDGVNGILAASPTEAGFREALGRIAACEEDALREIAANGVKYIRDMCGLDAVVAQEAAILRAFLHGEDCSAKEF